MNRSQQKMASLIEQERLDAIRTGRVNESIRLVNPNLQGRLLGYDGGSVAQRQSLAATIGQTQGNRHLQRILQRVENYSVSDDSMNGTETEVSAMEAAPLRDITGEGEPTYAVAFAENVALRGRTDAHFDGGSYRTVVSKTRRGIGCDECPPSDCVTASGALVSTFHVYTEVTLPNVDDFPDLTPCQKRRVQAGITNVLAPHEQQHVAAFRQYNGVVRQRFSFTICRGEFDARIQALHDATEQQRHAAAQVASDALDPFEFEVDLNCTEPGQPHSEVEQGNPDALPV